LSIAAFASILSLAAQALIVRHVGGVSAAVNALGSQRTLHAPFSLFILVDFGLAALVVWLVRRPPTTSFEWYLIAFLVLEQLGFASVTGSRSKFILPVLLVGVVIHLAVRPWRLREILAIGLVVVFVTSAFLVLRQRTADTGQLSLTAAPTVGIAFNDFSEFDQFLELRAWVPARISHQYGGHLVSELGSFVPHVVYPGNKPQPADVWFRSQVWGNGVLGGRPYTFPGELWLDFGAAGVLVGGFLLGLACRWLRFLPGRSKDYGAGVVGFAMGLIVLYILLVGVYTMAIANLFIYGLPLLITFALVDRARGTAQDLKPRGGRRVRARARA
jgi:oligosaccharide repeat unit polymerase